MLDAFISTISVFLSVSGKVTQSVSTVFPLELKAEILSK